MKTLIQPETRETVLVGLDEVLARDFLFPNASSSFLTTMTCRVFSNRAEQKRTCFGWGLFSC
ncbi:MAG: hypothetical protein RLY31_1431 [Bacteroidota bacterium]